MFRNRRVILSGEEREERLREDFSQAYTAHGAGILRYLLSAGMQTADAQDVLQNSFLTMWEMRTRIEDTANLAPLWFTIARHRMFDCFRKSRRSIPFSAELEQIPDRRNDYRELDRAVLRRRIAEVAAGNGRGVPADQNLRAVDPGDRGNIGTLRERRQEQGVPGAEKIDGSSRRLEGFSGKLKYF